MRVRIRSGAVLVAWLVAAAVVGSATGATAAAGAACRVRIRGTGTVSVGTGDNLQAAIDQARRGKIIAIRGTCVGTFVVRTSVLLVGKADADGRAARVDGVGAGTVLTTDARVRVRNLRITGGSATYGGGIYNRDRLRLEGTAVVIGNAATDSGGGIFNEGHLRVGDHAAVVGNTAAMSGGGIYQYAGGLVLEGHASVRANAARIGGGIFHELDSIHLRGAATVRGNRAARWGGGIEASGYMGNIVRLSDRAAVVRNVAGLEGGGVRAPSAATIKVCSPRVRLSPNDPDDPPATFPC